MSPDGGSGPSLGQVTGATTEEADTGVTALPEDSTGTVVATIDGAVVESDAYGSARPETRDADVRMELDVRAPSVGEEIIDDMEDGDEDIRPIAGRRGAWFTLNDGTMGATQTPAAGVFTMSAIPSGRGASSYAARTTGNGFKSWSPLFGFWMNKLPAGLKQTYDARKYAGISFWARTNAATPLAVRLLVPNADTDPDGKTCGDSGSGGCSDHFGKNFATTSQWMKHVMRFADLAQAGWGHKVDSFDAKTVYGVEFQFDVGTEFDCWIDDVSLLLP